MRLLLQRVREGKVTIEGQNVASIGKGLVVLVGFGPEDTIDLRGGKLWNTLIVVSAFCGRCAIQAAGTSPAGCVRCGHGRFPHKLGAGNALVGLGGFLADKRM